MKTQTKFLPLFLVLLLACLLPVSQTSAQNLVNNPGFETGTLAGWTQSGDTGFTGVSTGAVAHSGTYGLFAGPINNGFLSQTLSTIVGQVYSISFWLQADGPPNFFAANFGATTLFSMSNLPAGPYTRYAFTATATSTSTVLQFTFQDTNGFLLFDDVSVGTPDTGASAFLLLLGLAALGAARAFTSLRPVRA